MNVCLLLAILLAIAPSLPAQVVQLFEPNSLSDNRITIHFDELPNYVPANTAYQSLGVTFSRDDGLTVPVLAISDHGFATPSSNNVLFSGAYPAIPPTQGFTAHVVVGSVQPLTEIGAFFGNDQYLPEFGFQRLSLFGSSYEPVGSIEVPVNNNGHVDQFIGMRSTVPFHYARFENFTPGGIASPGFAIAIDNLTFTPIPEPSTLCLAGVAAVCGWLSLRRRRW
jgi:hypothetical protein